MKNKEGKKFSSLFHEKGFYLSAICLIMVLVAIGYFSHLSSEQENRNQQLASDQSKEQKNLEVYTSKPTINTPAATEITPKVNTSINQPKTHIKKIAVSKSNQGSDSVAVSDSTDKKIGQADAFTKSSLRFPVDGHILHDYTGSQLVKSTTLDEWCCHGGIDIEAALNAQVRTVSDGVVEQVYTDNDLGKTVVIDHKNGFRTLYANLLDNSMMKVGQVVKKGEIIGGIGKTAISEISDPPHLHFEMFQNDKSVNPTDYLISITN